MCLNRCCWGFSCPFWPFSLLALELWSQLFECCLGYVSCLPNGSMSGQAEMITQAKVFLTVQYKHTNSPLRPGEEAGLCSSKSLEAFLIIVNFAETDRCEEGALRTTLSCQFIKCHNAKKSSFITYLKRLTQNIYSAIVNKCLLGLFVGHSL